MILKINSKIKLNIQFQVTLKVNLKMNNFIAAEGWPRRAGALTKSPEGLGGASRTLRTLGRRGRVFS